MQLSPLAQRVLGSLVEKALATPQQYPLTLNSLRTACNQTTGREPVVDYDDAAVERGLAELREHRLVRTEVVRGSRTPKYSHRLGEAEIVGLDQRDQAIVGLLLLRGPQTEGELNSRSGRLYEFSSLDEVDEALADLASRGHVERLERKPGEKAQRWRHLWGPEGPTADVTTAPPTAAVNDLVEHDASVPVGTPPTSSELDDLRRRVETLEAQVAELREQLGRHRAQVPPPPPAT